MTDRYTLRETTDGIELVGVDGTTIWSDTEPYEWPNADAITAMIEEAGIGNPQKALFKTLFLGPAVERQQDPIE